MAETYTVTTLSPIRKVIAARMSEAKRTIPHFRLVTEMEVDALLQLRAELRERNAGEKLSLNDLLIKASASALMDVPELNIQWADKELHRYSFADLSIVTALDGGGLSTPLVRQADSKSVCEISRELKGLTSRAATDAKMDEIAGGVRIATVLRAMLSKIIGRSTGPRVRFLSSLRQRVEEPAHLRPIEDSQWEC